MEQELEISTSELCRLLEAYEDIFIPDIRPDGEVCFTFRRGIRSDHQRQNISHAACSLASIEPVEVEAGANRCAIS